MNFKFVVATTNLNMSTQTNELLAQSATRIGSSQKSEDTPSKRKFMQQKEKSLDIIIADYLSWLSFFIQKMNDNEKNTTYPYRQD